MLSLRGRNKIEAILNNLFIFCQQEKQKAIGNLGTKVVL